MDKGQKEKEMMPLNIFNEYKDFIKDKQVSFIIKKTERIVYGIYMLNRFVPVKEALSIAIKKTANQVLAQISLFINPTLCTDQNLDTAHARLQHLSSLLTISCLEGYISESNIEIIKNEINYLHKHLEELSTRSISESKGVYIKSDQFVVPHHKPNARVVSFKKPVSDKHVPITSKPQVQIFEKQVSEPKVVSIKKPTPPQDSSSSDSREKSILDILKTKESVSIKDISTVIFGVSEKTIQRALQTLIDKGQIIKEGERRWARYKLK
jgi:DNA-binding transcriptional ArsR family regulator